MYILRRPIGFGTDIDNAVNAIMALIGLEGCLFSYKNIYVATIEDTVCGVLVYNKNGTQWDTEGYYEIIKNFISDKIRYKYVSENYFIEASEKPENGCIEIVAVCVLPEFRRRGVGEELVRKLKVEMRTV